MRRRLAAVALAVSELLGESVVELLHGDLSIAVVVESSHEDVLLVVGHVDVQPIN